MTPKQTAQKAIIAHNLEEFAISFDFQQKFIPLYHYHIQSLKLGSSLVADGTLNIFIPLRKLSFRCPYKSSRYTFVSSDCF